MTLSDLSLFIHEHLQEKVDLPGETLYSSNKSFKKGDIYLLGANPGGADKCTIKEDLEELLKRSFDYNEYLHGIWPNGSNENPKAGEQKLQKRVQALFQNIGYDLTEVCTSNLIFFTSKDLLELKKKMNLSFNKIADICWPIHEEIISVIKPKIIISLGTGSSDSTFSYFKKKFNIENEEIEEIKIGHGEYKAKAFLYENIHYIFIPHLSYFTIKNEEVFIWIRNKLN